MLFKFLKFLFIFVFLLYPYNFERVLSTELQQPNTEQQTQNNTDNTTQEQQEQSQQQQKLCSNPLIQEIGLQGLSEPSNNEMSMCWNNEYSCCTAQDQNIIVERWQKESEYMLKRFEYYEKVYFELLQDYVQISDRAMQVMKILMQNEDTKHKEVECKILSRRILHLKVSEIFENVKMQIQKMHSFFEISYKGFYCSLCDPATSLMYEEKEQIAILSQKYCRDIVVNTLNPLLYLNIHIPQLSGLMTTFISRCTKEGVYDSKKEIDSKYDILANKANEEILYNCRENHNGKNWFKSCKMLCDQFEVTTYKEFFSPYIQFSEDYSVYLKQQIDLFDNPPQIEQQVISIEQQQQKDDKNTNVQNNENKNDNTKQEEQKKNRRLKKIRKRKRETYWRVLEETQKTETPVANNNNSGTQNNNSQQQQQQQQDTGVQEGGEGEEKAEEEITPQMLKEDRKIFKFGEKEIHLVSSYDKYGIDLYDYGTETEMVMKEIIVEEEIEIPKEEEKVEVPEEVVEEAQKPKVLKKTSAKGMQAQAKYAMKLVNVMITVYLLF